MHAMSTAYECLLKEHKEACMELRSTQTRLAHETSLKDEHKGHAQILAQDRARLMKQLEVTRCGLSHVQIPASSTTAGTIL